MSRKCLLYNIKIQTGVRLSHWPHLARRNVTKVEELIESVITNMTIGCDVVGDTSDVNRARRFGVNLPI